MQHEMQHEDDTICSRQVIPAGMFLFPIFSQINILSLQPDLVQYPLS